jgi:hypothetical protein
VRKYYIIDYICNRDLGHSGGLRTHCLKRATQFCGYETKGEVRDWKYDFLEGYTARKEDVDAYCKWFAWYYKLCMGPLAGPEDYRKRLAKQFLPENVES